MLTKKNIATAIATSTLLLNSLTPAFAATYRVSGNGSGSNNNIDSNQTRTTVVTQTNTSNITNDIDVDADTGGNDANDNTGGDVMIKTGDADVDLKVKNMTNSNHAALDNCGTCDQDVDVLIAGNGADSDNNVLLDTSSTKTLFQLNDATVNNDLDVDADTGDNDANDNTGGDVAIGTGDADVDVTVVTAANVNSATIGGSDDEDGNSASARIIGNGADSNNNIDLDFSSDLLLVQDNTADVTNDLDVDGETGENDANDNTGGDVVILSGDADVDVKVDNALNFNVADIGCDCVFDLDAKIDGNGSDSESDILADFVDAVSAFQTSDATLDNDLDVDGETGENDANDNTGAVNGSSDPAIVTGDADTGVTVKNHSNVNVFGDADFDLPEFEVDLDWSFMWGWLSFAG